MSQFFKNKKKFGFALAAVFLAVTLAVGSFAMVSRDIDGMLAGGDDQPEIDLPLEELDLAEEPQDTPEPEPEPVSFQAPGEMRGTYLVPGVDFMKTSDHSEATVKAEISTALTAAKDLTINAIIVDTAYRDEVIYQSKDAPEVSSDFDILGYILQEAREEGFYTYAIFDVSHYESRQSIMSTLAVGGSSTGSKLTANLSEFAGRYDLDGILLDGYTAPAEGDTPAESSKYASYLSVGGGIGFDNFLRQSPAAVVKSASRTVRETAPAVQVGLLADAVWENKDANDAGSQTQASFTALGTGNADTKSFIEKGYIDFVAVKAYSAMESQSEPFGEIVRWWADVARDNEIPMYVVHATDKLFTGEAGWGTADQLIAQIAEIEDVSGARGSIFNSLQTVSSNNQNITTNLKLIFKGEALPDQTLTSLEMTKPAKTEYTTTDPQVTFTGASDPDEPVTINGEEIKTDESGYFTLQKELKAGLNTFTIEHKDKKVNYRITRNIEVLKSASPMGSITTEGGMTITISALAYEDAKVYATVGGTTVAMSVDTSVESEDDRDGFFRTFTGEYTAPAATASEQNIGNITVTAEYKGDKNSIQAASIKVNKKAKMEDGVAVRITADQAITYPPDTLNNVPDARYYPLPAGAMDYAVGDEIVYKKDGNTYTYYVLASGLRVATKDITAISDDYPANNAISGLSVKSENGYTYVTIKTAQKVSYSTSYAASGISFKFHNTSKVPADVSLSKNPLFTAAKWNGSTLTLSFVKSGGFMGYKGYYDNSGNLVLRFKNPPASLSGARIAIDPGHGGGDKGASGFLADYPESVVNQMIAQAVAAELESRGATVNLMNNAGIEGEQRKQAAEKWGADLFVSIHTNSAPNINAAGTEVFYFHPFSANLAGNASSAVASGMNTANRGAKQSYYHVTLSSQMPSVLIECGFLTNQEEYEKLIKSKYHKKIAAGVADALASSIKSANTGVSASGSESVGGAKDTTDTDSDIDETASGGTAGSIKAESIWLDDQANVIAGVSTALWPEFYPEETTDDALTWKSSDASILSVDENGVLTPKKAGTATITVTAKNGGAKSTARIEVQSKGTKTTRVQSLSLNESDLALEVGGAFILRPIFYPDDASNKNVTWRSGSSSVASVSATGKVTALKAGTAVITATSADGSKKATCTVVVSGGSSASGTTATTDSGVRLTNDDDPILDYEMVAINPGTTMRIEVIGNSGDVIRGSDFTWESENPSIVTVDSKGYVTGKKVGEAYITATAKNCELLCLVEVTKDKFSVKGISFSESNVEVTKGKTTQLRATLKPVYATNRNMTWSSKNERIAKVDANGVVTGVNPGSTTITVKSKDGGYTDTCTVTVLSSGSSSVSSGSSSKVKSLSILWDGDDITDMTINLWQGDQDKLGFEYSPDDAKKPSVKWESKSPSIVTIDANGKIVAKKKGTATIVLTLSGDASVKATCRVKVE